MKSRNPNLVMIGVALTGVLAIGAGSLLLSTRENRDTPQGLATDELVVTEPSVQNDDLAYIDEVVQTLSQWDRDRLKVLLSPETLAGSSDAQLDQVLGTLGQRLGGLRSYEVPAVESRIPTTGEPQNLSAYRLVAYYEKGAADVSLVLQEGAGNRHLYAFNVEVPQQL